MNTSRRLYIYKYLCIFLVVALSAFSYPADSASVWVVTFEQGGVDNMGLVAGMSDPGPSATPLPGNWNGTTSRGYPMSFTVSPSATQWSNFKLKTDVAVGPCVGTLEVTIPGPGTITNGKFGKTYTDFVFTGQFNTSTTATGTYSFKNHYIAGCGYLTQSGTWTAARQGPRTISGTAGTGGVVLSYFDGSSKSVSSKADGTYSLTVSYGWSGSITPSHPCYSFNPLSIPFSNVTTNLTGQNFTATFTSGPQCAVTVGVFRPSNGVIFLKNSNVSGYADISINYGLAGDYPVVGDWDGNGTDTIGVYRNGTFLLRNSNTKGFADINFVFGEDGDQPIAGDWDGDGTVTVGVFRPTTAEFFLRNSLTAGDPDVTFKLGNPGDVAIAGDWNADGTDTTGVFRPSNGVIFLKNTNASGFADIALNYGLAGDKPVVGDWDSDGTTTIGVFRAAKFYLRNQNTNGFADIILSLGVATDMPIAGDWDGLP